MNFKPSKANRGDIAEGISSKEKTAESDTIPILGMGTAARGKDAP